MMLELLQFLLKQQGLLKSDQLRKVLPCGLQHDHDLSDDGQDLSVSCILLGVTYDGGQNVAMLENQGLFQA